MNKWLWALIVIVLTGMIVMVYVPALKKPHSHNGIYCASQLSSIGKACYMYMYDFEGKMSPNFEILVELEDLNIKDLVCPSQKDQSKSSYVYRGVDLTEMDDSVSSNLVVAYEQNENHSDRDNVGYRNVLFLDSHVKHFSQAEIQKIIAKDNQIRRKLGLAVKAVE